MQVCVVCVLGYKHIQSLPSSTLILPLTTFPFLTSSSHPHPTLIPPPLHPPTPVLDVAAFERLLGPCMDIMKRNFEHYEEQLMQLFGTTMDITDYR